MNGGNGEAWASTSHWKPEHVALRRPEPKLRNLSRVDPERTLLSDDTRRAGKLTAPALPPEVGGRSEGGEDAPDRHRHPVGIGGRLHILTVPPRTQHRLFTEGTERCPGGQRIEVIED